MAACVVIIMMGDKHKDFGVIQKYPVFVISDNDMVQKTIPKGYHFIKATDPDGNKYRYKQILVPEIEKFTIVVDLDPGCYKDDALVGNLLKMRGKLFMVSRGPKKNIDEKVLEFSKALCYRGKLPWVSTKVFVYCQKDLISKEILSAVYSSCKNCESTDYETVFNILMETVYERAINLLYTIAFSNKGYAISKPQKVAKGKKPIKGQKVAKGKTPAPAAKKTIRRKR